jgi:hypothetical protein
VAGWTTPLAAVAGGAIAGLIIGAGQALTSSRRVQARQWIPRLSMGMSAGLFLGAAAVRLPHRPRRPCPDGRHSTASSSVPPRHLALPRRTAGAGSGQRPCRHCGPGLDSHHPGHDRRSISNSSSFGASGALVVTAITGLILLHAPHPARSTTASAPHRKGSLHEHGLHVIFGTGAIGLATFRRPPPARPHRPAGEPVRAGVRSRGRGSYRRERRRPRFAARAARGATVIYQTMNPPYHQWSAQFPALQAGVLAAAETTGARLVSMENVYMYGRPADTR